MRGPNFSYVQDLRLTCFNDKNQHIGPLQTIAAFDFYEVNWCPLCGAVTLDEVVDGRLMRSFMQFPQITVNKRCETYLPPSPP